MIACEKCGAEQDSTVRLACHLRDEHGLPANQVASIAMEMDQRSQDRDERLRQAAPALLKELEAAVVWIEQIVSYEIFDPSAPSKHELLPQLRAAIEQARAE